MLAAASSLTYTFTTAIGVPFIFLRPLDFYFHPVSPFGFLHILILSNYIRLERLWSPGFHFSWVGIAALNLYVEPTYIHTNIQ